MQSCFGDTVSGWVKRCAWGASTLRRHARALRWAMSRPPRARWSSVSRAIRICRRASVSSAPRTIRAKSPTHWSGSAFRQPTSPFSPIRLPGWPTASPIPAPGDKKAILDGLARLAETSEAGDLVVFYFSGHGSQQPDLDGDEQGGADEIFLPYDVGKWSGDGVENALVDDELNVLVERILDKGADFFGIIDACHSATGFRAIDGDDTRIRGVEPAELGVPDVAQVARPRPGRRQDRCRQGRSRPRRLLLCRAGRRGGAGEDADERHRRRELCRVHL